MKPGSMADVRPLSDRPHAGNVYLLRGFIGIFSTGIDHLGEEINAAGVRAMVYQDDQWRTLADAIATSYAGQEGKPGASRWCWWAIPTAPTTWYGYRGSWRARG